VAAQFPKTDWIWRDGEFIPWESATLHLVSHVVQFGTSIFEGIRCYKTPEGPALFRLDAHLRRLRDSAKIYRMESERLAELETAIPELIRRNGLEECYVRPMVLRGVGAAGLYPLASPVEVYVVCWPWGTYLGEGALENGVDVCVSSWRRPAPDTYPTMAKAAGQYLNAQLIKIEARANGFAEGIALTPDGFVSEGSGENVFLVRNGELITPALDGSMLPGITRDSIITLAKDLGIPVREQRVPREMLYIADELFFTGTAAEVTPVRSVDRIPIGDGKPGPITRMLQERFLGIVQGRLPDVHGWRTLVTPAATQKAVGAA